MSTVVVIGTGEMGSAVARRLREQGAAVRTSLRGRGAASRARVERAQVTIIDDDARLIDGADVVPVDRAARPGASGRRAVRAGARQRREQAGLCRLQRRGAGDAARDRGHDGPERLRLRRRRHHRRPAGQAARGPEILRLGSGASCASTRYAATASTSAASTARSAPPPRSRWPTPASARASPRSAPR